MSVAPIRILSGEVQYVLAALQASQSSQEDLEIEFSGRRSARLWQEAESEDPCVIAVNGSAQNVVEEKLLVLFQQILDNLDPEDCE